MPQRNTRKTTQEFIDEVNNKRNDIILLEEYPQNRHTKIKVQCKKCCSVFSLTPRAILRGTQCPNCRIYHNKNTRSYDNFKQDLYLNNKHYANGEFQISLVDNQSDSVRIQDRVECICNTCGNQWDTSAGALLSGTGCTKCIHIINGHKKALSHDEFISKLKENNVKLEPLEQYQNKRTPMKFKCLICGGEYVTKAGDVINRRNGCPSCSLKIRSQNRVLDTFDFYKRVLDANPTNYCLEFYTGRKNKIKTQCGKCGHIWYPTAQSLLYGCKCPECGKSAGERRIEKYLKENGIPYIPQKTFEGLYGLGGGYLLYDFYLPGFNLLIEYQGEFHDGSIRDSYQPPEKKQQQFEHDRRKREYAKNNNIELLEIWYQDFDNIEVIIEDKLKQMVEEFLNGKQ